MTNVKGTYYQYDISLLMLPVFIFYYRCNKLPQIQKLKQPNTILTFLQGTNPTWGSLGQNQHVRGAAYFSRVFRVAYVFLSREVLDAVHSPCLWLLSSTLQAAVLHFSVSCFHTHISLRFCSSSPSHSLSTLVITLGPSEQ